jgi:hypothetical protein
MLMQAPRVRPFALLPLVIPTFPSSLVFGKLRGCLGAHYRELSHRINARSLRLARTVLKSFLELLGVGGDHARSSAQGRKRRHACGQDMQHAWQGRGINVGEAWTLKPLRRDGIACKRFPSEPS